MWAGGSGAFAVVALPLFLLMGIGGSSGATMDLCAPPLSSTVEHAAGPDSTTATGGHIDLPLAQADMAPPVPPESIAAEPWVYPVPAPATASARFGQDGPNWSSRHTGIDFSAPAGTPVSAVTGGVVQAVTHESAGHPLGTFAAVLHADNVVTVYAHLQEAAVARGQELAAGQQLGTVGNTGNSTGPHLHLEVRPQIGGRHLPVDPEPYLAAAALSAAGPAPASGAVAADCLGPAGGPSGTADASVLPELAREMTPTIRRLLEDCPELPAEWVYAQVMAESSWAPDAWTEDSNGGAAGLYQLSQAVWAAAEGETESWTKGSRPPEEHPVWEPAVHLRVGIAHACGNLREMAAHLADHPDKSVSALEAMAVCHVAGCSRVTGSASGIPVMGEAMCGELCVATINAYLANIHGHLHALTGQIPGSP
jgi:hypothetical protein